MFIARHGAVDFYHYDFRGQALAKIERGHARDLSDVRQMVDRELVTAEAIWDSFESVRPLLLRYPAIDAGGFEARVKAFLESLT